MADQPRRSGDPIVEIARAAAHRLDDQFGPKTAVDVEAQLAASARTSRPDQYIDPISLGGLIVATATLAWNVYQDLKTTTSKPAGDTIARTVRVTLRETDNHSPAEQDRIIDVVIDETLRTAERS
jgi:hypothetical protein